MILPTMKKAKYDAVNTGHYGLGFKAYTHFTSPIRRFNDLILHVIIKSYMKNDLETIYKLENLEEICNHISNQEINATLLEEQALEYKMASFMEEHLHEYFNGKILDITPNYLKIELENNIIGIAYINDIKGNNFKYDNKTYSIYNDSVTYKIGDYVRVKNIYTSKKDLKINFEILENITRVKYKKLEK
jgi:ribonuclease R